MNVRTMDAEMARMKDVEMNVRTMDAEMARMKDVTMRTIKLELTLYNHSV